MPTDRVIDGIDQTSIFLEGDTHGRRDYVFIYQGPNLGASVKGNVKKHWITSDAGAASGIGAAFYDLLSDTREKNPMLVNTLHLNEAFVRMRARHELWKKRYPQWQTGPRTGVHGVEQRATGDRGPVGATCGA